MDQVLQTSCSVPKIIGNTFGLYTPSIRSIYNTFTIIVMYDEITISVDKICDKGELGWLFTGENNRYVCTNTMYLK